MHAFTVDLIEADRSAATVLTSGLAERYGNVENPEFQDAAEILAHDLPRSLRVALHHFRMNEPACACLIRGYPVEDTALEPTPRHWRERTSTTAPHDIFLHLCASLLGTPIAWSTKQEGRTVHTIAPIRGDETEQLASGSETALTWHTEDAFHPCRADYLGLMCLRNPEHVPTTLACVHDLDPSIREESVLFEPRFYIVPDGSHFTGGSEPRAGLPSELQARARSRLARMRDDPDPVPLLFGDPASPYLRLDQYFTSAAPGDRKAAQALNRLLSAVEDRLTGYALAAGEVCFVDNYAMVHGRAPFHARYDGSDRWLRRLNVTRDLRKSRDLRPAPGIRLIA